MEEIEKNEYNLNIPRYIDTSEEEGSPTGNILIKEERGVVDAIFSCSKSIGCSIASFVCPNKELQASSMNPKPTNKYLVMRR